MEYVIIFVILCAQGYVAYLAWKQIESIRNFLSSEDHLKLKQTEVNLNEGEKQIVRKFLGQIQSDVDSLGCVTFVPRTSISVGDRVYVDGTSIEASVLKIFSGGSFVDSNCGGHTISVYFDTEIEKGSLLYKFKEETSSNVATASVSLITAEDEPSSLLQQVIGTINNYLKKNKGGAADFHLVKDIVERHTDSVDEEINHKLPVPIYLGLMGTVAGIIVGLFSLNFEFDPETNSLNGELFVNSVSALIDGVKLAMICSCVGLILTTALSSWRYMGAKSALEEQKNAFYDFIQTRLLPQMTKDAASTILALQSNLEKFNTSFEENIEGFGGIMDDIHATFDSQLKLQQELKRMDLSRVANLNANVLSQLRKSMDEFEKFTQYMDQMNTFVRSTATLTDSINDQLQRTEAVETVVNALQDNIQKNQMVMAKLREFLERVNEKTAVATAAGEIDSAMEQAINELKKHAQEQIESIRTYTTEATVDLHDLVNSERGYLRNLNNLGKLDQLDKLVAAINTMKEDNRKVSAALEKKIETLSHAVGENTQAQRGESGIPSWLKLACMVLFVVTCVFIVGSGIYSIWFSDSKQSVERTSEISYPDSIAIPSPSVDAESSVKPDSLGKTVDYTGEEKMGKSNPTTQAPSSKPVKGNKR